jgi:ketosteroid isomerase-like protein
MPALYKYVQTGKRVVTSATGDKQGVIALFAENIEWIIPGEDWPRTIGSST